MENQLFNIFHFFIKVESNLFSSMKFSRIVLYLYLMGILELQCKGTYYTPGLGRKGPIK